MFLSRKEAAIVASVVAKETGITIRPGKRWCIDMKSKVIEYPGNTWLYESDVGFIVHEAAHARFSWTDQKFFDELKAVLAATNKDFNQLWDLFAALEDVRVNGLIEQSYKGARNYINSYVKDQQEEFDFELMQDKQTRQMWGLNADGIHKVKMHNMSMIMFSEVHGAGEEDEVWNIAYQYYPDIVISVLKNTYSISADMKVINTPQGVLNIMARALPFYVMLCDDVNPNKSISEQELSDMIRDFLKNILPQMIEDAMKRCKKGIGKMPTIDDPNCVSGNGDRTKATSNGLNGGTRTGFKFNDNISRKSNQLLKDIESKTQMVFPQIKRAVSILKDKELTRYEGNYKSGKLQNRKLFKIFTGKTNIFSRKVVEAETKNLKFYILIDRSGSMDGEHRLENALAGCNAIAKSLAAMRKPFGIFGFNSKFWVHKAMDKKFETNTLEKMVTDSGVNSYDGSTLLGTGLHGVNGIIDKNNNPEQNIVICMTDGAASKGDDFDIEKEISAMRKVAKIYPIGIVDDCILEHFKDAKIVKEIEELAPSLISIFKESAGKRVR